MKKKIIKILGCSHVDPIVFNDVNMNTDVYGLYVFTNNVYVFKNGMDMEFDELTEEEQYIVFKKVNSGNWKVDKTLQ